MRNDFHYPRTASQSPADPSAIASSKALLKLSPIEGQDDEVEVRRRSVAPRLER